MLKLRTMVTAFIFHEGKVLFMKRAQDRKLMPGGWAPIGGHVEPEELNDPQRACIREIWEETGLILEDISSLKLRYIMHRRREDEIRIQYVFFGESQKAEVNSNEEGELYWLKPEEILDMETSATTRFLLSEYLQRTPDENDILIGAVSNFN